MEHKGQGNEKINRQYGSLFFTALNRNSYNYRLAFKRVSGNGDCLLGIEWSRDTTWLYYIFSIEKIIPGLWLIGSRSAAILIQISVL